MKRHKISKLLPGLLNLRTAFGPILEFGSHFVTPETRRNNQFQSAKHHTRPTRVSLRYYVAPWYKSNHNTSIRQFNCTSRASRLRAFHHEERHQHRRSRVDCAVPLLPPFLMTSDPPNMDWSSPGWSSSCRRNLLPTTASSHEAQDYNGSDAEREEERAAQEVCMPADGTLHSTMRTPGQDTILGLAGGGCQWKLRRRDRPSGADRRTKMRRYAATAAKRKRKGVLDRANGNRRRPVKGEALDLGKVCVQDISWL